MHEDDANYYRRRAETETGLAEMAEQPQAVAAHYQLATLYFERLEHGDPRESPRDG